MADSDLTLSPELEALVPAVGDVVSASTQGLVHPNRLARELLRFLRLKVLMRDTDATYSMSPPWLIDAAWHALLLETGLLDSVHEALGVATVHHSAHQRGGDAAREGRLLTTLSAAHHFTDWRGGTAAAATPPSTLPLLIWGTPPRGSILVRVVVLPLEVGAPRVLRTYMSPHANIQDLAAQLQCLSGLTLLRFRSDSPGGVPLHPTRLLSGVLAATGDSSRGGDSSAGNGGGSGGAGIPGLLLYAATTLPMQTSTPRGRPVSLTLDGQQLSGLDKRAPLHSLLPPPSSSMYMQVSRYPEPCMTVDETRLLGEFDGAHLHTCLAEGGTLTLLVTNSCPHTDTSSFASAVHLPEAWALADLQAWAGNQPGGPHTLLVDGTPPSAGFSYASPFGALELLWETPTPLGVLQLHVKTLTHKTVPVCVAASATVSELKIAVHGKEGIPADQQRLLFANRELMDDWMLCKYGISEGCTVYLLLRLKGC